MWLIIGVSGATCSGKSSLANSLSKAFPGSVLICQDDFFLPVDSERHTLIPALNHFNWEIMTSLDMDKMHQALDKILSSENATLVHLSTIDSILFNAGRGKVQQLCQAPGTTQTVNNISEIKTENKCSVTETTPGIHILVVEGFIIFNDKKIADLCHKKYFLTLDRDECLSRRSARTYDPPDVPGYFDLYVWPEYVKHRDQVFQQVSDLTVIEGTRDKTSILEEVMFDVAKTARNLLKREEL